MKKPGRRRPAAFAVDELNLLSEDERPATNARRPSLVGDPDPFESASQEADETINVPVRRWRWLPVLAAALGGLAALALGLAVDNLIRDLFSRTDWLGWFAVALAACAALAIVVIAAREVGAVLRLRRIDKIREIAAKAAESDDRNDARSVARDLVGLYADRPETARGRAALQGHTREIIDGRDLIGLAETDLLAPLDDAATAMVLSSAKRVALLTAVSPRAVVDLIVVGFEILRVIRRLAVLYAGRPGTFGFLRLARAAFAHLAITGGMAAGDSIVQQLVGQGIAARLSARLGEGVVNGLLTARIGIAAIDVCRPLPFVARRPPRLSDVMSELTRLGSQTAKAKDTK